MILLQKHASVLGCNWNSQVETDILELGERVATGLYDESRLGGAYALYWWRSEAWNNR